MKIDLAAQEGYNVATALRGPDNTGEIAAALKVLFTARLRHWMGVTFNAGVVRRDDKFGLLLVADDGLHLDEWEGQSQQWKDGIMHYLTHASRAFRDICNARFWDDLSVPIRAEASTLYRLAEALCHLAHFCRYPAWDDPGATAALASLVEAQYQDYVKLYASD